MNYRTLSTRPTSLQKKQKHRGCVAAALLQLHDQPLMFLTPPFDHPLTGQFYNEEQKLMMNAQQWTSDRRSYPRRDSGSEVALIKRSPNSLADEQQQEWNLFSTKIRGPLLDISMNGVSFLIEDQVEVSETVYLRLSNPKFDNTLDVKAHVIRAAKVDGNRWKVVCQFYQNLGFEEITRFARNSSPSYLV